MVSVPRHLDSMIRQSAVNMLSCENTAVNRQAFATLALEWLHVKYLLSIFTADCLRHPIQMAGTETTWELHTLSVIYS